MTFPFCIFVLHGLLIFLLLSIEYRLPKTVSRSVQTIVSNLSTKIVTQSSLYLTLTNNRNPILTLIEHLIPQGGTVQVLLSKSCKENYK